MRIHDTIAPVHEPSARSGAAYATPVDAPSVADGLPARERRPYAPGELVSLWDMLTLNARLFLALMDGLGELERITAEQHDRLAASLRERFATLAVGAGRSIDGLVERVLSRSELSDTEAMIRAPLRESLKELYSSFWEPILDDLEAQLRFFNCQYLYRKLPEYGACAASNIPTLAMRARSGTCRNVILDEIKGRVFVSVVPEMQKYLADKNPFGDEVKDKFLAVSEDMEASSDCLGVGLPTACIFHLFRVMEVGVAYLAGRLRATVNPNATWGEILRPIDAAIRALPGGPGASAQQNAKKAAFSEAAAYLRHVKDAWRNNTMHPKRTYTRDEAQAIFEGSKVFLRSLVKLPRR